MGLRIINLPLEILVLVFGFLSVVERARTVAQVCSSWRTICQAPLFWRKFTLPRLCLHSGSDHIQAYRRVLAQHADHFQSLHVVRWLCEVSEIFHQLQFPNLTTVSLSYLSVAFARALVKACPAVEQLEAYYYADDLDIEVLHILFSWQKLRRVDITCQVSGSGGDKIFSELFQNCEHLEWVKLCFGYLNYLNDQGLRLLARHHHTTLSRFALNSENVTSMAPLLDCRKLTHLELHISDHIPDHEIVALNMLPELTHLELNNNHPSSMALCRFFNRSLKITHLRLIDMDNITSEVIARIVTSCSQLQHLYIDCDSITDEMVLPLFVHTPHLHSMVLLGDMEVTDNTFRLIPSKLPQLKRLFLGHRYNKMLRRLLPDMDLDTDLDISWFHFPHI